jgi:citrate lyase subunit beta / citryl-CoA lyase
MQAVLFAPATRPDLVAKLFRSSPDVGVIDLEDAVPPQSKSSVRSTLPQLHDSIPLDDPGQQPRLFVRVNGPRTPWFADDLKAVLDSGFDGIVVPKMQHPDDLADVQALDVIAGIETGIGVSEVDHALSHPRVVAAYFGAEDFATDIGAERTAEGQEVLYARSRVVLSCRVHRVVPIDQAVVDVTDDAAFLADARVGRSLGYDGKLCIHPRQVSLVRKAFAPSSSVVARAIAIIAAYDEAAANGTGVALVDGTMIDLPLVQRARAVLRRAQQS